MLTYVLALVVGLGSLALYMAAFFVPEVHRKNDFIWSGVGLFYALVLWVCAGRITGGVLLGQLASVSLLGWLSWQTLALRRQTTPIGQQTPLPSAEELTQALTNPETLSNVSGQVGSQFSRLKAWGQERLSAAPQKAPPAVEEPYVPLTPADFAPSQTPPETASASATPELVAPPIDRAPARSIGSIVTSVQQLLSSFQRSSPPQNKSVYVRKQFRSPEEVTANDAIAPDDVAETLTEEAEVADYERQAAASFGLTQDSDIPSDAIVQEEIAYEAEKAHEAEKTVPEATLEATPPHPPSQELVEAAIEDAAEKHLPADPPDPA